MLYFSIFSKKGGLHSEPVSVKQSYLRARTGRAGNERIRLSVQPSGRYTDDHRKGDRQGQAIHDRAMLRAAVLADGRQSAEKAGSMEAGRAAGTCIQAQPAKGYIQLRRQEAADRQRVFPDGTAGVRAASAAADGHIPVPLQILQPDVERLLEQLQ